MYAFSWFKDFFRTALPFSLSLIALDIIFCDGLKGLLMVSLALIKLVADDLETSDFKRVISVLLEAGFICTRKQFISAIEDCFNSVKQFENFEKEYEKQMANEICEIPADS